MESRCFIRRPPSPRGRPELDGVLVDVVGLGEPDPHVLADARRQVLAHEVGADRQLAVAAVDQHRELDRLRPAELGERVERGADGAAGEEHVVDEHHHPAGDVDRHLGRAERLDLSEADVVAVEGDVERADRHVDVCSKDSIASARRWAIAGPAGCRPTRTRSSAPWLRSTISWAMRVCARRRSSASNTRVRNTKRPPQGGPACRILCGAGRRALGHASSSVGISQDPLDGVTRE